MRKGGNAMDYQRLLQGILDIGEAMLMSGAENFRIDDSLYRICKSYGFVKYDVSSSLIATFIFYPFLIINIFLQYLITFFLNNNPIATNPTRTEYLSHLL